MDLWLPMGIMAVLPPPLPKVTALCVVRCTTLDMAGTAAHSLRGDMTGV
jgi:hypothetical protein